MGPNATMRTLCTRKIGVIKFSHCFQITLLFIFLLPSATNAEVVFLEYPDPLVWWHLFLFFLVVAFGSFCIGSTGAGGIIVVPAMLLLPGMTGPVVIGTTQLGFLPLSLTKAWLWHRAGKIAWRRSIPLCITCAPSAFAGQIIVKIMPVEVLGLIVALFCTYAGVSAFRQGSKILRIQKESRMSNEENSEYLDNAEEEIVDKLDKVNGIEEKITSQTCVKGPPSEFKLFLFLGAFVGFCASISGSGSPLIFFPIMLWLRPEMPMHEMIGLTSPFGLALQAGSISGAFLFNTVDIVLASIMATIAVIFVSLGTVLALRMNNGQLKRALGCALCFCACVLCVKLVLGLADIEGF